MSTRRSMIQAQSQSKRSTLVAASLLLVPALVLSACGTSTASSTSSPASASTGRVIEVAATENFWGSIASQVGGVHVHVVSIITNPNTDPHAYEPTAADARTLAQAQFVVENGIGYDPWAPKLLAADQGRPTTLNVGSLLGLVPGDNPHRWYNPSDVQTVIKQMVTDFRQLDPADSPYFVQQAANFNASDLKEYNATIAAIRARYSGTPVGASESIFAMLAPSLGLNLVTPSTFLKAISEGTEVSVADKETIDSQIRSHQIKIYVYNSQNVTPDVQAQLNAVKAEHIPFATITESLQPASTTYEAWQTKQLLGIQAALAHSNA
jgi:zinc/manganese transport system substrate-binding protein